LPTASKRWRRERHAGVIHRPGLKLADAAPIDPIEFVRVIALARILIPLSHVRLTAGPRRDAAETQAPCLFAGVNSTFVGDTLLAADNLGDDRDSSLLRHLGVMPTTLETAG
jgi:biotin synthase